MSGQILFDIALATVIVVTDILATINVVMTHRWQQEQRRYWREKRERA